MTIRNTLTVLIGLTAATLSTGCGTDEVTQEKFICTDPHERTRELVFSGSYGPTEREVPGVEYKVQSGDNFIELVEVSKARYFTTGYNHPSSVLMQGDNSNVHYDFGLEEFVVEANQNYNPEQGLMAGVNLVFPDFDGDGKINGVPGEQAGTFTLSGQRDEYDIFDVSCRKSDNSKRSIHRGYSNDIQTDITFTRTSD